MTITLLLEGFAPAAAAPPADFQGPVTSGDRVRVSVKGKPSIVGRVVRPHGAPISHAVVAPEGGGAHVLAPVGTVKLDTPAQHALVQQRQAAAQQRALAAAGPLKPGQPQQPGQPAKPGQKAAAVAAAGKGVSAMLEAFMAAPETPAQSNAIGARQVAAAKTANASWTPGKHPRAQGGKFGYTTGGKRATRSPAATQRTLGVGAKGALVKSIQRQLGLKTDGQYGPNTKAAVTRYQQQHHLQVDGVVGAQTIAALSGNPHPERVKPGPITAKAATVRLHKTHRRARKAPVNRTGGGVVV